MTAGAGARRATRVVPCSPQKLASAEVVGLDEVVRTPENPAFAWLARRSPARPPDRLASPASIPANAGGGVITNTYRAN